MRTALFQLADDFLTAIVFVIIYLATGNLAAAVGIAIAIGTGQFALLRFRGRRIDVMQYLSVGLVIALGGISLVFDDPRFVLLKPSAVHFAIACGRAGLSLKGHFAWLPLGFRKPEQCIERGVHPCPFGRYG
jgi:intracellular septation protein A